MSTQVGFMLFMLLLLWLAAAFALTLWARFRGRKALERHAILGAGAGVGVYGIALLGAGLSSQPKVLPVAAEKYFCELDCHLAYRVVMVRPLSGGEGRWEFLLQTRFDETTISARRSRVDPTWPAPRRVTVIGSDGESYPLEASADAQGSRALTEPLAPGAHYITRLEGELPSGVVPQQLKLQDDIFLTQFLIDNERSPFHAPILQDLPAPAPSAS
ncbi:MAG: hypothetical protein ABI587_00265 [Gemmatimonadales bacterium]